MWGLLILLTTELLTLETPVYLCLFFSVLLERGDRLEQLITSVMNMIPHAHLLLDTSLGSTLISPP